MKEKLDSFVRKAPKPTKLENTIENCNPKHLILLCTNLESKDGPSYLRLALEGCQNWKNTEECVKVRIMLMKQALEKLMPEFSVSAEETNGLKFVVTVVDISLQKVI